MGSEVNSIIEVRQPGRSPLTFTCEEHFRMWAEVHCGIAPNAAKQELLDGLARGGWELWRRELRSSTDH